MKHTPWKWNGKWLFDNKGDLVLWYTTNDDGVHCKEEHKNLIAAAPELFKVCKEFVQWFDYISTYQHENLVNGQTLKTASNNWGLMVTPSPDINKMCDAIAKAEGVQ